MTAMKMLPRLWRDQTSTQVIDPTNRPAANLPSYAEEIRRLTRHRRALFSVADDGQWEKLRADADDFELTEPIADAAGLDAPKALLGGQPEGIDTVMISDLADD